MQEQQLKPVVLMAFIRGLRGNSIELARKVRNANPPTLEKALQKAQFIMSDPFIDESERPEQDAMQHELAAIGNMERPAAAYEQNGDDVEPTVSSSSSNVNSWLSPEWMEKVVSAIAKTQRKCGYCGKEGHLESECFKKRRDRRGQALSTIPKRAEGPRL
ncbi:hypothetical protein Pmar_PMAR006587 [Perkinsus marinus ATCC 50983]|nr:hypothetical protein Pmar_PMAR006587 [Perkinsus marinus ATCC 50983]EER02266.1 hypothetical protein Pmar_PMAR006587 [Perkinsus marinus ATCC 50983]|eukprot:XP_002769548.1 hypothetical protein Pmar_PMAR006587 [Perkinsus marinus ATCC 50983]